MQAICSQSYKNSDRSLPVALVSNFKSGHACHNSCWRQEHQQTQKPHTSQQTVYTHFRSGNLSNRNDVTGTLMDQTERSLLVGRNYQLSETVYDISK